ncbi:efflux RND transporter periplasmic adaptor subunit [Futiania mangrovi]|uniref:Efflux RND transporter periplasmic adaptor subunit n=1 Tax=Futiania mangrovi TaxID=2959716 RepID=A0A9J6PJ59_9PROT|nr:efflux RND transporter periplasmic adaptor subunit [Futiania mangrovii]MCP1337819.1 efflux RND transporter periplasmic adaptor subunit [Futiania mangrovii]
MRCSPLTFSLLAAFALYGCDEAQQTASPEPVRAVKTITVADGAPAERRVFPGVLVTAETMRLGFPVAGRLLEAPLREGEAMKAGDTVARLDPAEAQRQIDAARARLAAARGRLTAAEAEFQRKKHLFERDLIARAAFDRVSADVTTVRAELRVAETELASAEERLERSTLIAPRDGVVTALLANPFEELGAGSPVYEVAVTAALEAEVLVPEGLVGQIGPGTPAEVRLPAYQDRSIPARVTEIAAEAEAGAAFRVRVRLQNPPPDARNGLSAAVTFALERAEPAIEVPLSALAFLSTRSEPTAGDSASVYVFDEADGRLSLRKVRIEGVSGNRVLVTEGLSPGERVVVAGVALLEDGQRARLWMPPE